MCDTSFNMFQFFFLAAGVASSVGQYVINCNSLVISQYRYWLFVSDLNSVFSYRPVAMMFMTDDTLSRMWFSFLSYFQGRLSTMFEFIFYNKKLCHLPDL